MIKEKQIKQSQLKIFLQMLLLIPLTWKTPKNTIYRMHTHNIYTLLLLQILLLKNKKQLNLLFTHFVQFLIFLFAFYLHVIYKI